jgi:hypothetical protein
MRYFHANSPVFIITAFLVYQPDMFKVPHLPSRSEKFLYDPKASHNLFYKNVYCKIPENPFSVLQLGYLARHHDATKTFCSL